MCTMFARDKRNTQTQDETYNVKAVEYTKRRTNCMTDFLKHMAMRTGDKREVWGKNL